VRPKTSSEHCSSGFGRSSARVPEPTSERRSANMRAVRGKDTAPELAVRKLVHRLGYRYRLHLTNLPGKPDLVFPSRRKIILVHGCFWHGHTGCPRAKRPGSNEAFWREKLDRNIARDATQAATLAGAGWHVLVIWECEIRDREQLEQRIVTFLESPHTAAADPAPSPKARTL
jgi:DNA mismatch endonuclease (patch repair protein)